MEKVKLHTRMYGWKHVWLEFADEFQGTVNDPNPDSSHTGMSIMVPIKNTPLVLVFTSDPDKKGNHGNTIVEANFSGDGSFKFTLHPQKHLVPFTKLFGMQDIIIGNKDFDPRFVIKGSDVSKVRDLLANSEIQALLIDEPTVEISTHPDKNDSNPSPKILAGQQHMLSLKIPGIVDDFERLKNLYKLVGLLLISLCSQRVSAVEQEAVAYGNSTLAVDF